VKNANERIAVSMVSAVLVIVWGCGDGKPPVTSSTEEATVKGTVTIKGKRAKKGEVLFDPSNYRRADATARSAPISSDGTYEIKTLVGENTVRVGGPEAADAGGLYLTIPIDVKAGEINTLNIELPAK
jgi:hypothetical protein